MRISKRNALQWSGRVQTIVVAGLFVIASVAVPLLSKLNVQAAGENLSTVTDKVATLNDDIAITDLQVNGTGDENISITVHAPSGSFEVTDPTVTVTGAGTNAISLSGIRSAVNTTLATLVYTPSELGTVTVTADFGNNVGNVIFNNGEGGNGHAYIVVNSPLTWANAAAAAETYTFGGQPGYLATITSSQENDYVYAALNQQTGWIGANDVASEGSWGWRVGPEAGAQFWSGDFEGSSVDGEYSNWAVGEPNNGSGTEDCAQFWSGGYWNDLNCTTPRPYVVEFGGDGPLEPIQTTFTITTVREAIEVSTCEQLFGIAEEKYEASITLTQDIDCGGQTVSPLFKDHGFMGVLDGAGYTLGNFVINEPTENNAGVIGYADSAVIRDLTIKNAHVTAQDQAGVLIGASESSLLVENVHVRNSTLNAVSDESDSDADDVGGLIGELTLGDNATAVVTGSSFEGKITVVDGSSVGGLVGSIEVGESSAEDAVIIEKSYAAATISVGSSFVGKGYSEEIGGLVGKVDIDAYGYNFNVIIRDVYSWSTITHADQQDTTSFSSGGLIGAVYTTATEIHAAILSIQRAYANGAVQSSGIAGGLIGLVAYDTYSSDEGTVHIENSFAAGKVSASEGRAGGLIGVSDSESAWSGEPYHLTLTNTYFDQTRTGQTECASDFALAGCVAVNADGSQAGYFINNTSSAPLDTWDFETVWVANTHVMPTFKLVVERDGDGIADEAEMAAPNNGDGNNDGVADVDQAHVASLVDPTSNKHVTLVVDESCNLSDVFVSSVVSHDTSDAAYAYSTGFVNFTATGCANGSTDVQLFYHGVDASNLVARKYNPNTGTYFTITTASLAAAASPLSGTVVSYTVVDNGDLDVNATEGVITDPVGLASVAGTAGVPNTGIEKQVGSPIGIAFLTGLLVLGSAIGIRQLRVKGNR